MDPKSCFFYKIDLHIKELKIHLWKLHYGEADYSCQKWKLFVVFRNRVVQFIANFADTVWLKNLPYCFKDRVFLRFGLKESSSNQYVVSK